MSSPDGNRLQRRGCGFCPAIGSDKQDMWLLGGVTNKERQHPIPAKFNGKSRTEKKKVKRLYAEGKKGTLTQVKKKDKRGYIRGC